VKEMKGVKRNEYGVKNMKETKGELKGTKGE
jgi:hypothetical protein